MTYNVYVTGCFSSQQNIAASSREEAISLAISNIDQQASDLLTVSIDEVEADFNQPYISLRTHYSSLEQPEPQETYTPMSSVFALSQTQYTPLIN